MPSHGGCPAEYNPEITEVILRQLHGGEAAIGAGTREEHVFPDARGNPGQGLPPGDPVGEGRLEHRALRPGRRVTPKTPRELLGVACMGTSVPAPENGRILSVVRPVEGRDKLPEMERVPRISAVPREQAATSADISTGVQDLEPVARNLIRLSGELVK